MDGAQAQPKSEEQALVVFFWWEVLLDKYFLFYVTAWAHENDHEGEQGSR